MFGSQHRRSTAEPPPAYSIREAAERLHIGETMMKRAVRFKKVHSILVGRARRIPGDEIERVLREGLPHVPRKAASPSACSPAKAAILVRHADEIARILSRPKGKAKRR